MMEDLGPDQFPEPRMFRGQLYECIESAPHRRRDGRETLLSVWQSHCWDCGAAFTFTVPLMARKFEPNRRCQRCKRPGQRVRRAVK